MPAGQRNNPMAMGQVGGWLLLGNLLVALVLATATLLHVSAQHQANMARAYEVADNLAHSLSVEVAAELRMVDNALVLIAQRVGSHSTGDAASQQALRRAAVQEQVPLLPFVSAIRFADLDGKVDASSTGASPVRIEDRDYFQRVLQTNGPVLSDPLISRVLGEWCVVLSRRILDAKGQPLGVVYAVLASRHFSQRFAKLALGQEGAIALRTQDFKLVARYAPALPGSTRGMGEAWVSEQMHAAVAEDPHHGSYTTRAPQDGVERVNAYRRVPGFGLLVVTGLSTEEYASWWNAQASRAWGFTLLVMLMVVGGSVYVYRQHRREREALHYASRLAKQQHLMIENEWVGMLRVRNRQIEWVNEAVCRMSGYPRQVLEGASTRILYPNAQAFEEIGRVGYQALHQQGGFKTQMQLRTSGGQILWVDCSGIPLSEQESAWTVVDIHALKSSEACAQHQALHDALTGLPNRRLFDEQLRQALAQARRSGVGLAVCFLDLDGFKPINDRHGHEAGDLVLCRVAERLVEAVRANDLVARLGGDEFALVLTNTAQRDEVQAVLARCLAAVQQDLALPQGATVRVGCSIGVALAPEQGEEAQGLLSAADAAMYAAKLAGRGRVCFAGSMPAQPS